jgi:hypothetical protein
MRPNKDAADLAPRDRRTEYRHEVQRPCRLTPSTSPKIEMGGFTTNVSRSGMLVRFRAPAAAPALPKVGEFARIFIDLPASGSFTPRSLECAGRVVRIEDEKRGDPELAFEILTMKIRTKQSPRAPRKRESGDLVQ